MILTPNRSRTSLQPQLRRQQLPDQLQIPHQQFQLLQLVPRQQQQPLALSADSALAAAALDAAVDLDLDLDFDTDQASQSLSSSPLSTRSLLSQYSSLQHSPLFTFDSLPSLAGSDHQAPLFGTSPSARPSIGDPAAALFSGADPMPDAWIPASRSIIKSARRTASHQRDSSISSLSSATGPASPYSQNLANPRIAVTDSLGDLYLPSTTDELHHMHTAKPFPSMTHDSYYANFPAYNSAATADASALAGAYPNIATVPRSTANRELQIPGAAEPLAAKKARPASVASSVGSDSPPTPAGEPGEDTRLMKSGELFDMMGLRDMFMSDEYLPVGHDPALHVAPKLDRTMTDIYSDELYDPSFTMASASSGPVPVSPNQHMFAQALQAANSQHLATSHSPVSTVSTGMSPFRNGSPLAPVPAHDFSTALDSAQPRWRVSQQPHRLSKIAADIRSQNTGSTIDKGPQTISPKDAVLEYHEPDGDADFPLFPQDGPAGFDEEQINKAVAAVQSQQLLEGLPDGLSMDSEAFTEFLNTQIPTNLQIPQHYPFIAQPEQKEPQRQQEEHQQPAKTVPATTSASPGSSRMSAATGLNSSSQRPVSTIADGGTYTCTYHGCTKRFETPALLQKHKREGHRQPHPNAPGGRRPDSSAIGMTSMLFNTQAGPHKCDRINPSTGKPCAQVFSRPYDLTRHEDTIHNARKQKVRCDMCTEAKTFSRADALTRHYRVCHPGHEPQGKHRKRAVAARGG